MWALKRPGPKIDLLKIPKGRHSQDTAFFALEAPYAYTPRRGKQVDQPLPRCDITVIYLINYPDTTH